MSEFAEFAETIRADLFGKPERAKAHEAKQAAIAKRAELADTANRRQGARARIVDAGIPDRVMSVVREVQGSCIDPGYELADPIPQAMRAIQPGPTVLLVLLGPPGEGKSVAAGYALAHAIETGRQGLWRTGVQLARELGSWDRQDSAMRHRAHDCDVLVIDDAGMESARDPKSGPLIAGLLLSRYEAERPTIVTSNLPRPDDLRIRYGAQIIDRLRTSGGLIWRCVGRNYRGQKT